MNLSYTSLNSYIGTMIEFSVKILDSKFFAKFCLYYVVFKKKISQYLTTETINDH